MATYELLDLLGQYSGHAYANPFKLLAFMLLFLGWISYAQWADKDAIAVNTFRSIWNTVTVLVGAAALVLMILLPNFWAAAGVFAGANLAVMISYVIHRNGLVAEESKVCTPAHISRLMKEGFRKGKDEKKIDVRERVRLTGADRKVIPVPDTNEERIRFAAVQDLMYDALLKRASRIDVTPGGEATRVRLWIDGMASDRPALERAQGDALTAFLKEGAGLSVAERRKPQKGQMMAALGDDRFDLVVRTNGSNAGENAVIRIFGADRTYKVGDLGLTAPQVEEIRNEFMHAERGLMVCSAPRGQGLTTTLYSFARSHDAFLLNIQMLEFDRDITIDNITQNLFAAEGEKTFATDLIKMIRSDPDVLVVPDVRDRESATALCNAAARKQRVYVGIPANDIFEALTLWVRLVGEKSLVAKQTSVITHQRLVRMLCSTCKTAYKPSPTQLQKLNLPADKLLYRPPEPQYDKHGNPILCQACGGGGYLGRTAIVHWIRFDDELRKLLAQATSLSDLKAAAVRKGMQSLLQVGLQKVVEGVTSIEEVARVTQPANSGKQPPPEMKGKPTPKPVGPAR